MSVQKDCFAFLNSADRATRADPPQQSEEYQRWQAPMPSTLGQLGPEKQS